MSFIYANILMVFMQYNIFMYYIKDGTSFKYIMAIIYIKIKPSENNTVSTVYFTDKSATMLKI